MNEENRQMMLRQCVARVIAFQIPAHTLHISIDHIDRWNRLVRECEQFIGASLTGFEVLGDYIKLETKEQPIPGNERFGIPNINRQYQTVYTGNQYCERSVIESQKNALELFLRMELTAPEQEAVEEFKKIKVKGFGKS